MVQRHTDLFPYSGEELQRQFTEATHRAAQGEDRDLRAVAVSYDKRTKRVIIELTSGVVVQIPSRLLQGLADASPQELAAVILSPQGTALHWDRLDADFNVVGLLAGIFGTRTWMTEIGRKGGRAKSAAKAAAARANGQKGGRPPVHQRPNSQRIPARRYRDVEDHTAR